MALVERVQSILADMGEQLQPMLGDIARRVRVILLMPRMAWPEIAQERHDALRLFLHYILPLSAIPPLAKLIGWSLLSSHEGIGTGLAEAVLSYGLSLAGVAALALIAAKLAPRFEGGDRFGQALKLIAYSATAGWVGGLFRLVPVLGILSLFAWLYGGYLLYTGAPSLMDMPEDRVAGYAAILIAATLLVFLLISVILAAAIGIGALGMI